MYKSFLIKVLFADWKETNLKKMQMALKTTLTETIQCGTMCTIFTILKTKILIIIMELNQVCLIE